MSFNKSAVAGFVNANEKELITASILGAKTLQSIKYQPGVKGSAQINTLTDGVTIQDGSACGWNAAGTTTLSKRNIVTGKFKVNEALCERDLVGTFAEYELKIQVGLEKLPFEAVITDAKVKGIQKAVELLAWNGDTTGGTSTYLDITDGLVKIIGSAAGVVDATPTGATTLLANSIDAINLMVANIPVEVIDADDLTIFAGYDVVMKYITAYNASNQFAGTLMLDGKTMSVTIPNTMIKLQGVGGLNGKNKAYLTPASNLVAGGDIQGDEAQFKLWYSDDNQEFRFVNKFNIGFNCAFPSYIVKYTK